MVSKHISKLVLERLKYYMLRVIAVILIFEPFKFSLLVNAQLTGLDMTSPTLPDAIR